MKAITNHKANDSGKNENRTFPNDTKKRARSFKGAISRRSFLGTSLALGAGTIGAGLLPNIRTAEALRGGLTAGEAGPPPVPAAPERIQAHLLFPYNQNCGHQHPQSPERASQSNHN